jgi:hypothetical protein
MACLKTMKARINGHVASSTKPTLRPVSRTPFKRPILGTGVR